MTTYIVLLAEAEESADLGGSLGTEALGVDDVGQAGDVGLALLDDGEGENGEVHADDATTDGLAATLTAAAGSVAGVAVGEEESDTGRVHDTLLHGETLLVVAAGDLEDITLELIAEVVTGDFLAHLERGKERKRSVSCPSIAFIVSLLLLFSFPFLSRHFLFSFFFVRLSPLLSFFCLPSSVLYLFVNVLRILL